MELGGGPDEFSFASVLQSLTEDGITVMIVKDHDVFVAAAGVDREASSLVGRNLAGDDNALGEN